jgi:hypothetical protein
MRVRPLDEVDPNQPKNPADWLRCFEQDLELQSQLHANAEAGALHVFALAPLPILFHLGMVLDRWHVIGYQQDRGSGEFTPAFDSSTPCVDAPAFFKMEGLPEERRGGRGVVLVSISVTHTIASDFEAAVARSEPPLAHVRLVAQAGTGHDAFRGGAQALCAASELRQALDQIRERLPGTEHVALALSCPGSLALALGRAVNPRSQRPLTLYNYRGGEGYVEVYTIDDHPAAPKSRPPAGLLLLAQPGLAPILDSEQDAALPQSYRSLRRTNEQIDLREEIRRAKEARDFTAVQRRQEAEFRESLEPRLDRHADYRILYFGSAPVPLAMHLGALIGTWRPVEVFLHDHARREWTYAMGTPPPRLREVLLPEERDRSAGEAIIRVSASHQVDRAQTRRCVPEPLLDIDIALEHPREDAFRTGAEMTLIADEFKRVLDYIADRFSGVRKIHVFAAVQPGVAFLLGTRISPTMHPPVQTYEYLRTIDPPYYPAILIHGPPPPEEPPLTEDEIARAQADRERLDQALARLRRLSEAKRPRRGESFAAALLPKELQAPFQGEWRHLPALRDTVLARTRVDTQTRQVPDSFRLDGDLWQLDDRWLARLARRLPDDGKRLRALRLLVLHEAAHRGPQALTTENSEGIGRFARILEAMDYQADLWAQVHEYVLAREEPPESVEPPEAFFQDLITIATETMWVFDEGTPRSDEIQVRRLHRFLIWYWQREVLRHGTGNADRMTAAEVLQTLVERPQVELAGPEIKSRDERVYFMLDRVTMPELAIYDRGQLNRYGERFGLKITDILDGIRRRDGSRISAALRGAVAQTRRR